MLFSRLLTHQTHHRAAEWSPFIVAKRWSKTAAANTGPLTTRERQVAALVARGLSNRQIAARLVISTRTASNHVEHILNKLGLRTRSQIAVWAVNAGLEGTTKSSS